MVSKLITPTLGICFGFGVLWNYKVCKIIKANEMRAITEANGNIAEKEFLRQVNIIEKSIKERAEKGANNTFFTYVQGGTPFNILVVSYIICR